MEITVFIIKWFIILPICAGILIMPLYLLGAFILAAFRAFKRASGSALAGQHSR